MNVGTGHNSLSTQCNPRAFAAGDNDVNDCALALLLTIADQRADQDHSAFSLCDIPHSVSSQRWKMVTRQRSRYPSAVVRWHWRLRARDAQQVAGGARDRHDRDRAVRGCGLALRAVRALVLPQRISVSIQQRILRRVWVLDPDIAKGSLYESEFN